MHAAAIYECMVIPFLTVATPEPEPKRCRKCNDTLGHDDDGPTICRFCDAAHEQDGEVGQAVNSEGAA